jgi:hypothetical protein
VETIDSPENKKRVEEFEQKLEEHDAAEAAEKTQIAKRYNPREACRRSTEIRIVHDETLGEVRFGVLSISEFTDLKLSEIKDENARIRKVVYAMLKKADRELTLADVEAIPFDEFTILNGILGEALPGFLRLAKQALKTGLQPTQTHKSSG